VLALAFYRLEGAGRGAERAAGPTKLVPRLVAGGRP
jgi:hypothetical protein